MKSMKFGVLYIKEKERASGEKIAGGGPPAFGWYTATLGYIYHKEGGRNDDLKYVATVLDKFPWNEQGWWSADIDVNTGISKQPLTKPSPINKNASIALASAMMSQYVKDIDPSMSARLKQKADHCIYKQIIPAQEPDGFWHYGLTENDPTNKDILGYFMVTVDALMQLPAVHRLVPRRGIQCGTGQGGWLCVEMHRAHDGAEQRPRLPQPEDRQATPAHYTLPGDLKRGFQLGAILFASKQFDQGVKIVDFATKYFPYGNTGEDGAHASDPSARVLLLLSHPPDQP